MSLLYTILAFLVALALLIVVHEFGHYWAARACGVKVLRFCVGFGRTIVMRRLGRDRTEWAVAIIPVGGYVKLLDEQEGSVSPGELHRAFNRQVVWRRAVIIAAGPAANFFLAILLYWILFVGGVTEPRPILAEPEAGTPAARAGLSRGQMVTRMDEQDIVTWQQLRWKLLERGASGASVRVEVINTRNEISWHRLDLADFRIDEGKGDPLASVGLRLHRPDLSPVIGRIIAGQEAERAGLLPGDRVLRINGRSIVSWEQVVSSVRTGAGVRLDFEVERAGQTRHLIVIPDSDGTRAGSGMPVGRIGAAPRMTEGELSSLWITVRHGPAKALELAVLRTWETAWFSLRMIGKMLIGEVSWRNLSGPVTIADYAGQSAQLGITPYLAFLALISISLGVLNLLPIPLLDGGHLMYYAVEVVKGGPVSDRVLEIGQRLGVGLLIALMAFAFFNDISRLVHS